MAEHRGSRGWEEVGHEGETASDELVEFWKRVLLDADPGEVEIDVGSRWSCRCLPEDEWRERDTRYSSWSGGDIEPVGFAFEAVIRERHLLRRNREAPPPFEHEIRTVAVVSPKPIAD